MKTAIELIADERRRQIEIEGWTAEHDDKHITGELADAAVCYAMRGYWRRRISTWLALIWPFGYEFFKPSDDRISELKKAGALLVAEIERLQRIQNAERSKK